MSDNNFVRKEDKDKDITVDLSGSDKIAELENFFETELGGKVIEHHAKYSDWQTLQFENPSAYVMVRTVYRLVKNVVQLLTLQELVESKQENRDEFIIHEFEISQEYTHDDIEQWNNSKVQGKERKVHDYYIDREVLAIQLDKVING